MDAISQIMMRAGVEHDEAVRLATIAADRIRSYLSLPPDAVMDAYKYAIIDISVLYWQYDNAVRQSSASIGYSKETYSEGGVSHTVAALSGSAIWATYNGAIEDVLRGLNPNTGKVVFM